MTLRCEHHRDPQDALRVQLRELASSRVRYGYRRLMVLLKREGWEVNAKRIYRLHLEEGLMVRTRKRKERAQRQRVPLGHATRPNQKWSTDFVAQRLADGRWMRVLTMVDQFTRECVCLHADGTLSGERWLWHLTMSNPGVHSVILQALGMLRTFIENFLDFRAFTLSFVRTSMSIPNP